MLPGTSGTGIGLEKAAKEIVRSIGQSRYLERWLLVRVMRQPLNR
jgi:hypothetical protein